MGNCDLAPANEILGRYPAEEPSLIQVLQDVQRAYGYLPCDALVAVAGALRVPLSKVFSVATFYKAFSLNPRGRTIVKVCTGTACHIRGAGMLVEEIERRIGIRPGQTTEDMAFTLETVNCVGACAMAPVVIVGEKYHGAAKAANIPAMLGKAGGGVRDAD
jgi:NADH-quinone oxidoreductase subunit E